MALPETLQGEIYSLITKGGRRDPLVTSVVPLLKESGISTLDDLINTPEDTFRKILNTPFLTYPITLRFALTLRAAAELNLKYSQRG